MHLHIIIVILSNCPMLSMDSPSMCRLGSFSHMLSSGSDAEFRQCLPVVLRVHILSAYCRDVYQENSGEVLPKFCIGSGAEHGKTNPIYTYSGGIRTYPYLLACRLHGRNKADKLHELMDMVCLIMYIFLVCPVGSQYE